MTASLTEKGTSLSKNRKMLNTAGLRSTTQRSIILDIIRQGQGHLDADEVYRQAKEKQPRLSLSTVYRTLQKLKSLGMIEELHFDEAHHHYEIKHPAEHHHLSCISCGKVIEFQYPLTRLVKKHVPEAKEFDITQVELHMAGYCESCGKNKK
jgi:Fe2+ or Zn2+ uptake regulation protein